MNTINKLFGLTGKTALITGGSGSLGTGMTKTLLEAGAHVIVCSEDQQALEKTQKELSKVSDGKVFTLLLDVSKKEELQQLDKRLDEYPAVDILINAAGINIRKSILDITLEDWDRVLNINLRGTYFVSQTVAKRMIQQGSGKIINVASLTSAFGFVNMSPYGASKGGVSQITKSMANEWAEHIQVNAIAPGFFETELTRAVFEDPVRRKFMIDRIPQGRPGKPEDLYGIILFLSSPASDYVTGQTIYIDGGVTAS